MIDYPEPQLFIGGGWRAASDGSSMAIIDPATEQEIGRIPRATPADVDEALEAAARGFAVWRALAPSERAEIVAGAARLLRERRDEIARTITWELGKPLAESREEVVLAAAHLQWNAEEALRTYGRVIPGARGRQRLVIREPVGPVAAFSGWNAPAVTPSRKIGSALAVGCSVVLKAATETPATACALAAAFADAGLPAGVLNVLFGDARQISTQLITSDSIRAVTFTGSTEVGKSLAALAGGLIKRCVMELGGHAPVVVGADVAVDEVAEGAARSAYRNAGQVCTSPTRFFVHRSCYDDFVEALSERVRALPVGNGFDEGVQIGPLANARGVKAISELVDEAVSRGARVTAGGRRLDSPGFFFEPTVLCDVDDEAAIANEEPFGPITVLSSWSDVDEVVRRANRLPVGLAGYVFTGDHGLARRLAIEIDCGALAINGWRVSGPETPFGGHKDSGLGSEGGTEGVEAFLQTKFIDDHAIV